MKRWSALPLLILSLAACHQAPRTGLDFPGQFPERLSDWHLFERDGDRLVLNAGLVAYDLNSPLFSDYAHKLRTVLVPRGTAIGYGASSFDFPVGTVISKTFYYPRVRSAEEADSAGPIAVRKVLQQSETDSLDLRELRLLETRLLVNTASGWVALPYVWNAAQSEATLTVTGEMFSLVLVSADERTPFTYLVPDTNQCAGCHALEHHRQAIEPIGVKARHLNKDYHYAGGTGNQLEHWQKIGLLKHAEKPQRAPRNAQWDVESTGTLEARARAYLDVNCGHCHRPRGAASTSGLLLDATETDRARLGRCKIPIAAGRGAGTALFDIVPGEPGESILLHRMASTEPDVAMPELGRSLVHAEGLELIREWIASLPGACIQASPPLR